MLVYRSFVVGMLGAIALLIASLPAELEERRARAEEAPTRGVIHVSHAALEASSDPRQALADLLVQAAITADNLIIVVEP